MQTVVSFVGNSLFHYVWNVDTCVCVCVLFLPMLVFIQSAGGLSPPRTLSFSLRDANILSTAYDAGECK